MGDSIFELTEKTGYESPWDENWVKVEMSSSTSVNFLNKKSSYEINEEHLLRFKFYGYENWLYRKDYDVSLSSSDTTLHITTKSWELENGNVFLTKVSRDKPGKVELYISVNGYHKRTYEIEFVDSSESGIKEAIKDTFSEVKFKVFLDEALEA